MINAKEAYEQSMTNYENSLVKRVKNARIIVELAIEEAIHKGDWEISVANLPEPVVEELLANGYKVKNCDCSFKISWYKKPQND